MPVSGEVLAEKLGISRPAVAKHITALRELGFEIEAAHHVGYRLLSAPDITLPETVEPLVSDPLWVGFEGALAVTSTNDEAKRLARAGATEGTVVVAARQEGGRGRLGRTWESPEGGAYFSAILRPGVLPTAVSCLALVVALGVADGLAKLGVQTGLKWPNDVLLDGRKLAGILLEMSAEADKVEWVVAGVGINVRRTVGVSQDYACVEDVMPDVAPGRVAACVLDGIARMYRRFLSEGFAALAAEYMQRDVLHGLDVTVRDATGVIVAAGFAGGVDEVGRLRVGDSLVFGGEVTMRDEEGGDS